MANTVTSQIINDNRRNLVVLLTGILDTANETRTVKVQLSALTAPVPTRISIARMQFAISPGLSVALDWNATTPIRFAALSGAGELSGEKCDGFMSMTDNSGAGRTGDIYLTTFGWAGTMSYTILLELDKRSF